MSESPQALQKSLPITWAGVEAVPIQMANQFLVQVDAAGDRPDQLVTEQNVQPTQPYERPVESVVPVPRSQQFYLRG